MQIVLSSLSSDGLASSYRNLNYMSSVVLSVLKKQKAILKVRGVRGFHQVALTILKAGLMILDCNKIRLATH